MKNDNFIAFLKKHSWLEDIFFAALFAFVASLFFSTSVSPLYPANNVDTINLDSNFFTFEATLLNQGYTPYLDFFDHKGLYHIAVTALGLRIAGRNGVFFLEIVYGFTMGLFFLRSIRLVSPSLRWRLLGSSMYLLLLSFTNSGNIEAEWLVPFVSIALYFFLKGIKEGGRWPFYLGCFFSGLEMSLSLNSRPLDGIWTGIFLVAYFVYYLQKQRDWTLLGCALTTLVGFALPYAVILPCAIQGGYLEAMTQAIFKDNFSYLGLIDLNKWMNWLVILLVYLAEVLAFLYERKQADNPFGPFFFSAFCTALPLLLLVAHFISYYFSGYPFLVVVILYFFSRLKPFKREKLVYTSLVALFSVLYAATNITLLTCYYTSGIVEFSYSSSSQYQKAIDEIIPLDEQKRYYAIDVDCGIYLDGPVNEIHEKYFANQSWWAKFLPGVVEEVNSYLSGANRPEWLVVNAVEKTTAANFLPTVKTYYNLIPTSFEKSEGYFYIYQAK